MSFLIRNDDPMMGLALARGVGTDEGRQIIDRIIYERELNRAEEARIRAERRQYGDERIVNTGQYDRPYVRQPRNAPGVYGGTVPGQLVRGDRGGFGIQQGLTPYQQAQLSQRDVERQRRDALERDKISSQNQRDQTPPPISEYQRGQLEIDRNKADYQRYRDDVGDARNARNDADKYAIDNEGLRLRQEELKLAREKFEAEKRVVPPTPQELFAKRRGSGNQAQDAAAIMVATVEPATIAFHMRPLLQPFPTDPNGDRTMEQRFDSKTGEPISTGIPAEWSNEQRTLAANLARAIEDIPFERRADGYSLYSIPEMKRMADSYRGSGVPGAVVDRMEQSIASLSEKVVAAIAAANQKIQALMADPMVAAADPDERERAIAAIIEAEGNLVGMSPAQLLEAKRYYESVGQ